MERKEKNNLIIYMNKIYNYSILFFLLSSLTISLILIQFLNLDRDKSFILFNEKKDDLIRFTLPCIFLTTFFLGCYFVSLLVDNPSNNFDYFSGIYYLLFIAIVLLIINATTLHSDLIQEYIKGKKFSNIGVLMVVGIGSILFGFIDNFGMRLGTEALDDVFLQGFLAPFSRDKRFTKHKKNISTNLKIMNIWASEDWRKVINHTLRFEKEILKHKELKDLSNVIRQFKGKKLNIPNEILKSKELTNQYVDNIRSQYDVIDGSKSMMGNTFSNFCAALLAAGIFNLFTYLTAFDDNYTGDNKIDNDWLIKNRNIIAPVIEAIGIVIGCLIPIFLNIAMKRNNNNNNTFYSWIIILIVSIVMILMLYFSVKNISPMTTNDKKMHLKKHLNH